MREPFHCKGCIYSKMYRDSGWACERSATTDYCIDGSVHVSKGDAQLSRYPEGRRE